MKRKRLTIHGRVQGVGFRAAAKQKADYLGICGWVKNQPDGTVLMEAEGEEAVLNTFVDEISKGPTPFSSIRHIDQEDREDSKQHNKFKVIH
ncbi:UNVERIFIED_CONTAM: acylphosphatase [Halobacillus marinus]|uniref:acylphosphatase n=1 Tax=Bacillus sp. SB49 TaxID=1071080 RepID=UPI000404FE47|nr:acylphosphatase [Bacillus sp. SB49]QHT46799.1 acylphosphatase [Bacillus sp. SB49]